LFYLLAEDIREFEILMRAKRFGLSGVTAPGIVNADDERVRDH